jgi:hypothetical protein
MEIAPVNNWYFLAVKPTTQECRSSSRRVDFQFDSISSPGSLELLVDPAGGECHVALRCLFIVTSMIILYGYTMLEFCSPFNSRCARSLPSTINTGSFSSIAAFLLVGVAVDS